MSHSLTLSLSKTGVSLGPITLTVTHGTRHCYFKCYVKFSLHFTSKCNTLDHFWVPKNPHFQIEAKCTTFLVTMSFICMWMKNHFHIKGQALNVVLIQRPRGTRKWPVWKENLEVLEKSLKAFPPHWLYWHFCQKGLTGAWPLKRVWPGERG